MKNNNIKLIFVVKIDINKIEFIIDFNNFVILKLN